MVVEGPEGSGKTTLSAALARRLRARGADPVVVRDPGGTPVADALRAELLDRDRPWTHELELLYYVTARADLVTHVIRPALEAGRLVLSDRYELSTRAYQGAGRGVDLAFLEGVNAVATGGLRPDLTLIIDLPPDAGTARQIAAGKQRDRLDREPAEFHARVARRYLQEQGPGVHHLDGTQAPEALLDAAWEVLEPVLESLLPAGGA